MWVLFLGDVVGKPGRKAVAEFLSRLRGVRDVDLVIANGENAASGMGLTDSVVRELFEAGVDVLTGGNHVWDKKEGIPLVRAGERILRPANYPPGVDGRGWGVFRGRSGTPYAVVSLIGRVFMGSYDCPFRWADAALPGIRREAACVVVDFHAEATSESGRSPCTSTGRFQRSPGRTRTSRPPTPRSCQAAPGTSPTRGCAAPPGRSSGWIRRRSCGASSSRCPSGSTSLRASRRRRAYSSIWIRERAAASRRRRSGSPNRK